MRGWLFILAFSNLLCLLTSPAQTLYLKDGRTIPGKSLKIDGNNLFLETSVGSGTFAIPLSINDIDHIEPADAEVLTKVKTLLVEGKMEHALEVLTPFIREQEIYQSISGNMFQEATFFKAKALLMIGKRNDAEALLKELSDSNSNTELALHSKLLLVKLSIDNLLSAKSGGATLPPEKYLDKNGPSYRNKFSAVNNPEVKPPLDPDSTASLASIDAIIKQTSNAETLADAWLYEGQLFAALNDPLDAVLSLLHVPAFYGTASAMPTALLAGAMELDALGDQPSAAVYLNLLVTNFSSAAEAEKGKIELRRIQNTMKATSESP